VRTLGKVGILGLLWVLPTVFIELLYRIFDGWDLPYGFAWICTMIIVALVTFDLIVYWTDNTQ